MNRGKTLSRVWIAAAAAAVISGAAAAGQPEGERPARGPGMRDGPMRAWLELPEAERRAKLRELLEARKARNERARVAIDEALKSLDADKPLEDIVEAFPPEPRADLRPGGRGPGGGPPGPDDGPMDGPGRGRPGEPGATSLDRLNELGPVVGPEDGPGAGGGGRGRGGGGGGREGGEGREIRPPLTDADREAFDEFLGSAAPRLQQMLRKLREQDATAADQKIIDGMPRIRWLLELRERDREMYDLRLRDIRAGREALDAARALAALGREGGEPGQREKLEADLRLALETQYDLRGQILAREITRMDSDLARRRDELARRPEGKAAAVERSARTMVERAREMGRRMRERHGGRPDGEQGGRDSPDHDRPDHPAPPPPPRPDR